LAADHHYEGQNMKSMFGLVGILVVFAIVGVLVKTQLKFASSAVTPAAAAAGVTIKASEGATPAQESQQIQQQVKDKVNAAIQSVHKPDD
jgi:hypothetical protein